MELLYIIAVIADFVTILAFVLGVLCFRKTISQKISQFGWNNKAENSITDTKKKK